MFKLKHFIILSIFLLFSNTLDAGQKIVIGISKASGGNYENYGKWLMRLDSNISIIDFFQIGIDSAKKVIDKCDGIVLSGGPDVHPAFYNRPEDEPLCTIDNFRDTLEFVIIQKAIKLKLPILAICRGLQILNVALGGDLIADIPTQYKTNIIHQNTDKTDAYHNIKITNTKLFKKYLNFEPTNLVINSNHHQAIKKLSKQLEVLGRSEDGIIEILTWKKWKKRPFLIAMQWHPERLWDRNSDLSDKIGIKFIKEARKLKEKKTIKQLKKKKKSK